MQFETPDRIYGELFQALHLSGIWADGKMLSDAVPNYPPAEILAAYDRQKNMPGFDLKAFFESQFTTQLAIDSEFSADLTRSPEEHIRTLWDVLSRTPDKPVAGSTLIPLPFPYLVPGGRFNEIYYWDSYFTMLGLRLHDRWDIIEGMIQNFAWLIEQAGFIPNGNRSYFLGRSQPPFFSLMLDLLAEKRGLDILVQYLPALLKEHTFWMNGEEKLSPENRAVEHVVWLDGGVLNRYYDRYPEPRQEMYKADVDLHAESGRSAKELFLDIRAACESGWDFSARWFRDKDKLTTIEAASIIPVDLNCLLVHLENTIARASETAGDTQQATEFRDKATRRAALIREVCWQEDAFYHDYHFVNEKPTDVISLAALFPLFFGLATDAEAEKVAQVVEKQLLVAGGVRSTNLHSGQQWDAPNGWAPLQWITVQGLHRYGHFDLARTIAERWVALNEKVYHSSGKFLEKYNVEDLTLEAGGGEYPVQDGFGWSNGVYLALKAYSRQ